MSELEEQNKILESPAIRLSPSSINTFLRCPREFYYTYIERLPTPPSIHLIKGSIIHKVLERFFIKYESPLAETMRKLFEEEWANNKSKLDELKLSPEDLEKEYIDSGNIIDMYLRSFLLDVEYMMWNGKAENERHAFFLLRPKFREKFYEDKELNLCGFVDRIHTDWDGNITIADYKTSNRYGVGLKDEYELQLSLYALLHERNEGIRADYTSVIFLRFGKEVMITVTPDRIKNAITLVTDINNKIKTRDINAYPRKEGKMCKWCCRFGICSGQEEIFDKIRQDKVIEGIKNEKV